MASERTARRVPCREHCVLCRTAVCATWDWECGVACAGDESGPAAPTDASICRARRLGLRGQSGAASSNRLLRAAGECQRLVLPRPGVATCWRTIRTESVCAANMAAHRLSGGFDRRDLRDGADPVWHPGVCVGLQAHRHRAGARALRPRDGPVEHLPAMAGAVRSRRLGQRACPHRATLLRRMGATNVRACRRAAALGRLPAARSKPPRHISRFVPV